MALELCPGGELFYHIKNLGRLTENQAKFYFAEIAVAVDILHENGIIYRDLKPENVLIDAFGHVKLADFGACKFGAAAESRFGSFCGSPEYMSPEMLQGRGYTRSVDFYTLGALLYELLTGLPPFYDRNRATMYRRIQKEPLSFPKYLSSAVRSLLSDLLTKDANSRMSSLEAIKSHPWCHNIPWVLIENRQKSPPFLPNVRKSNFDPEYTSLQVELPLCDTPVSPGTSGFSEQADKFRTSNPFRGLDYPETENVEDFTGLVVNSLPTNPEKSNNLSSISTDVSKSPESTRFLSASLADKIREIHSLGFENGPAYMTTEPVFECEKDSPRFVMEARRLRGPGFTPVKPSPKCRRGGEKARGSFGETSAKWSDSDDF